MWALRSPWLVDPPARPGYKRPEGRVLWQYDLASTSTHQLAHYFHPPARTVRSRPATSQSSPDRHIASSHRVVPACHVPIESGPPHRRYLAAA